ncbi:MAG: hypothetical protein JWN18_697 [Parcubacteria group bacterium]|nr:hypothetical protein [Parcubacteria group bacterium]
MRALLYALTAFALLTPGAALAQLMGTADAGSSQPFTISVGPQYPAPFSKATLSILSDSISLTNATMTVSVGGKKLYEGNAQPVAIPLGKAGVVTNVTVVVRANGSSYRQNVLIQPQDVALVSEPISSAPPLYPGKPFVPLEGDVRLVAVASLRNASGNSLDPAQLSYTWTVDGTRIDNFSGIGKSAIIVASPLQYRSREVSVVIASQDGTVVGGASTSLDPLAPSIRTYVQDPLLGILYDHAISGSYTISSAEATLYTAPFSLPTTSGSPFIQWFLNGSAAQTGRSITLRPSGEGGGAASLSVTASSGNETTATSNYSISFGTTGGSNFFGL